MDSVKLETDVKEQVWQPVVPSHFLRHGDNIVAGFAGGTELALWRSKSGEVQAWENRCPHRGTRFTLGRILDDKLSCAYHGWEFAASGGRCVSIPAHPDMAAPKNVCATTYAAVERDGMVWVSTQAGTQWTETFDPSGTCFVRTLGLRATRGAVEAELRARRFEQVSASTWKGRLDDQTVEFQLNTARERLTLAHVWVTDDSSSQKRHSVAASLKSLRSDVERRTEQGDKQ